GSRRGDEEAPTRLRTLAGLWRPPGADYSSGSLTGPAEDLGARNGTRESSVESSRRGPRRTAATGSRSESPGPAPAEPPPAVRGGRPPSSRAARIPSSKEE